MQGGRTLLDRAGLGQPDRYLLVGVLDQVQCRGEVVGPDDRACPFTSHGMNGPVVRDRPIRDPTAPVPG